MPGVEVDDRLVERAHAAAAEQLRRAGRRRRGGAATAKACPGLSADAARLARAPSHPGPARNRASAGVSGGKTTPAESPHPQGAVNGGTEAVGGWPRGRIAVHSDGVALSRREPDSSPRRCTVGEKTEISGHGYPAQPGPHSRIGGPRAGVLRRAGRPCRRAQEGRQGPARRVRAEGPRPARRPHLRQADQARRQALPAPPRPDRRRHRRARHVGRAQARPRDVEPLRPPRQPRQRPRPPARARHRRRRRLRPRHAARRQALPAQQGPDARRRRRARDLVRARPPRRHEGAQAPPRRDPQRRRRPADHRAPRDRRGQPDRAQALPLRRRPRAASTTAATTARARSPTRCTAAGC